jgi:hypothetical protein
MNKKINFFLLTCVCALIIGCQSDEIIVEQPAELLDIQSVVEIDNLWSKNIFSNPSAGKNNIVLDDDGIYTFSSEGLVSSFSSKGTLD